MEHCRPSSASQSGNGSDNFISGWTEYFTQVRTFLHACGRLYGLANEDYTIERLLIIRQGVSDIASEIRRADTQGLDRIESTVSTLLTSLAQCIQLWTEYLDQLGRPSGSEYVPGTVDARNRGVGRPRFDITREQLVYLRSLRFTVSTA